MGHGADLLATIAMGLSAAFVGGLVARKLRLPAIVGYLVGGVAVGPFTPGLVADGRDMGSVVFRDAGLKIFLTASPEERALRRYKQLKEKGLSGSLAALSAEIAERDRRDTTRSVAPLIAVPEAVVVDSTALTIEEVVGRVIELARERFPEAARGR